MSALDDARSAVQRSDMRAGSGAELPALRDALRALIQHVEQLERKLDGVCEVNSLWDGS